MKVQNRFHRIPVLDISRRRLSRADNGNFLPKAIALAVASCFVAEGALANPTGGTVVSGSASISQQGNLLSVINTPGAIINWRAFSIGTNEITRFIQQSAASTVLNRVVGVDPSVILGTLQSNGRVFLINPNGVLFGAGSTVDVAGLVASTLNLSNADFLAGRLKFTEVAGAGSVINQGTITTPSGGQVYLVAPNVQNSGIINSPQGEVILAAGKSVEIVDSMTPNLRVQIDAPDNQAVNVGQIIANSGKIGIYAGLIKNSGEIRADGVVVGANGEILLKASKNTTLEAGGTLSASDSQGGTITVQSGDTTLVSGEVRATGSEGGGGNIKILGNLVGLTGRSIVDASGRQGGGSILVGGDFQGKNTDVQNAWRTYVGSDVTLRADSGVSGDGGKVIVWSDEGTQAYGKITARGGTQSGNGGFVETSGKGWLDFAATVDTSAPHGAFGTLLLDPKNIDVDNAGGPFANGVNNLFANNASGTSVITATSINAQTSNVVLQANNDITFTSAVSIANSGTKLTAQAGRSILVNNDISTNNGDITLIANETTSNGVVGANRDPGAATITMAPGTVINAGSGDVRVLMRNGSGHAGSAVSGDITLSRITGRDMYIEHDGIDANNSILMADAASGLTARSIIIDLWNSGSSVVGGGSIGTSAEPIKLTPNSTFGSDINVEAHSHWGNGGIFLESTGNLTIGGAVLFSGAVKGVQTISGGPIELTAAGTLTTQSGSAICGFGGGTGGPICAGGGTYNPGDTVFLRAADMNLQRVVSGWDVYLAPYGSGTVTLGSAGAGGSLHLSQSEVNFVDAFTFNIGDQFVSGDVNFAGNLTTPDLFGIRTSGHIASGGFTLTVGAAGDGNIDLYAQSGIQLNVKAATLSAYNAGVTGNINIAETSASAAPLTLDSGTSAESLRNNASGGSITLTTANRSVEVANPVIGQGDVTLGAHGDLTLSGAAVYIHARDNIALSSAVGNVLIENGAEVRAGNGSFGAASVGITSTSGNITIDNAKVWADGGEGGIANVTMSASGGIFVIGDGGAGAMGIFSHGGSTFGPNGGAATIDLSGGAGGVFLDSSAQVNAAAGNGQSNGGAATINFSATGAGVITVQNGSAVNAQAGNGGSSGFGNGGAANITFTAANGGILIDNADIEAYGGNGGASHGVGDGFGGNATITLTATGTGSINIQNGSWIEAGGGNASTTNSYGNGGTGKLAFTSGSGGITIDGAEGFANPGNAGNFFGANAGAAIITLNGGGGAIKLDNGANLNSNYWGNGYAGYGAGGAASITFNNTSGIMLDNGSWLYAEGGTGYTAGGVATVDLTSGATGITLDRSAYIHAFGGSSYSGSGGDATVTLNAGGSSILLDRSAYIQTSGGDSNSGLGGAGSIVFTNAISITLDRSAHVSADGGEGRAGGGLGSISLASSGAGGILVDHGASINAYGGSGGDGGEGSATGGAATISLTASGSGPITIRNGASLFADAGGSYNDGGNSSITLNSGSGGISLQNAAHVVAQGGQGADGGEGYSGNGGVATITFGTTGAINIFGSTVTAYGGNGGNSFGYGQGGSATINLTSGNAGITVDGGEGYALYARGGHGGYYYGYFNNGGSATINLTANSGGAITVQNSAHIKSYGGDGAEGSGGSALVTLTAANGINTQSGTSIDAQGGAGYSIYAQGNANVNASATTGNFTLGSNISADGAEGGSGIQILAQGGSIAGAGGVLSSNGTIRLGALNGVGSIGNPVQFDNGGQTLRVCNGGDFITCSIAQSGRSGDVVLAVTSGDASIDSFTNSVKNFAPNGGYDFTALSGNMTLSSGNHIVANGSGIVGLHALGTGNTVTVESGAGISTSGGTITLQGDAIVLNDAASIVAGSTGTVALKAATASQVIDLGGINAGSTLGVNATGINGTYLAAISAGNLQLGDLTNTGGINVSGADVTGIAGKLSLVTNGSIGHSGLLTSAKLALNSGNGTINIATTSDVSLQGVTATGNIDITSAGAISTVADIVSTGGGITLQANGPANDGYLQLALGNGTNITAAGPVSLTSTNDYIAARLANEYSNITGSSVALTAAKFIQTGAVSGQGNITATSGNIQITTTGAAVDGIVGGCAAGCWNGSVSALNGNVTVNATGWAEFDGTVTAKTSSGVIDITAAGIYVGADMSAHQISLHNTASSGADNKISIYNHALLSAPTIGLTSAGLIDMHNGATLSGAAVTLNSVKGIAARVAGDGSGLSAVNTTTGDIVVTGTGSTFNVGGGYATFSNTGSGSYYITGTNDLVVNGGTANDAYAAFAAGGLLTSSGYSNASGYGVQLIANGVTFNGSPATISGALGVISGGAVNAYSPVTAGSINVVGASINVSGAGAKLDSIGGNFVGYTTGNVTVSNGGLIQGNPDVVLTVGGNILIDGTLVNPSKISAISANSVNATFPTLSSGGYAINGQPGVVYDAATNTGFFGGGIGGVGFKVNYGAITNVASIPSVVSAINTVINSTNSSAPNSDKQSNDPNDSNNTNKPAKGNTNSSGNAGDKTVSKGLALQCN